MTSFLPIVDGQDTPRKRNINIEYEKSLEYAKKAIKIQEEIFGDKHPDLAQWWHNEFHFPLEYLTSGELGHFKKPKSLDEIRNRLIEAGL